jgi:hypothetical protein
MGLWIGSMRDFSWSLLTAVLPDLETGRARPAGWLAAEPVKPVESGPELLSATR